MRYRDHAREHTKQENCVRENTDRRRCLNLAAARGQSISVAVAAGMQTFAVPNKTRVPEVLGIRSASRRTLLAPCSELKTESINA